MFDRNPNYNGHAAAQRRPVRRHDQHRPEPGFLQVKSGQVGLRRGGLPPTQKQALLAAGLLNKQFFVNPTASTTYVALNTSRGRLRDVERPQGRQLRDRPAARCCRARGAFAGTARRPVPGSRGMPGYKDMKIYPIKGAEPAKAKTLF